MRPNDSSRPKAVASKTRPLDGPDMMAIGDCMRASRWGLYEKYLAQNKMTTFKVNFCSG